ncbi:cobalamin biosynthesis protein CobQ [Cognatishimia sp.]|uniref:cobalamin biosynthesis protein CobQ n=1 Tax=Cognatishimia sp. TaxID=2211648 RepID=UPI003BA9EA84
MNTPAHLLLGWAVFGRRKSKTIVAAALIGALLPDLSLYLLAGTSLFVLGITPEVVFGELYFSELWQTIFAIDNSFIIWSGLLALAMWSQRSWAIALCGAALLHLALDFPLHHDDGRAHFWPISDWIFASPVSYWDNRHFGSIVGPIELGLAVGCSVAILSGRVWQWLTLPVAILLMLEAFVVLQWFFWDLA